MTLHDALARIQWAQVAKWSKIDLSNFQLQDIPDEIRALVYAVKVDLSRNQLTGINPLLNLSALTKVFRRRNLPVICSKRYCSYRWLTTSCASFPRGLLNSLPSDF